MKIKLLMLILTSILSFSFVGCADDDDPVTVITPNPPNENQNDNDNNGNDITTNAPWAIISLYKDRDPNQVCILDTQDRLIIQENGRYLVERCEGIRRGRITAARLNDLKRDVRRWLESDSDERICAELSPSLELELRMLLDNGREELIYEEKTAAGLCTYGSRLWALAIYQDIIRIYNR